MNKCPVCNTELPEGAKFCRHCGNSTSSASSSPAPKKTFNKKLFIILLIVGLLLVAIGTSLIVDAIPDGELDFFDLLEDDSYTEDTDDDDSDDDLDESIDNEEPDTTDASDPVPAATIEDALAYLNAMYKADEGKKTPADYKLAAQIDIEGTKFTITWTSSNVDMTFVLEDGLYTAKIPSKNDTETEYILTATITDANGTTVTEEFTRVLPVYDSSAIVSELVAGEAYKMYMNQANLGTTLFALGETQSNKYIKTSVYPTQGLDFYAEKVEGGYKFYTIINGVKNYVHATTTTSDEGKINKYLGYATESDCVYYFKAETNAWYVMIGNVEYVLCTYSDYTTICISESSYMTAETTGVTQFPVSFMLKADAEALTPTEGPADPTELTSISAVLKIANALENSDQTTEKYLVQGTITKILSEQYGNMYIEDKNGNSIYIYGVYSKDGSIRFDTMDPQPKVGDTITVMGVLSKYNDAPQMKNVWVQEIIPGSGNGGSDTPATEATEPPATEPENNAGSYVTTPEVGKSYKLGIDQATTGEIYYFTGEMSGHYGATSSDKTQGVNVTVESAGTGKYYLSFTVNGVKKYIGAAVSGTHLNFLIVDESERATFTWNSEYATFVTTLNSQEVYMGTYSTYQTVGIADISRIASSYPVHLYN